MIDATKSTDDGRDGPPFLATLSSILFAAGGVLLLPRQFASAGIAFGLGLAFWALYRRRHPKREEATSEPDQGEVSGHS